MKPNKLALLLPALLMVLSSNAQQFRLKTIIKEEISDTSVQNFYYSNNRGSDFKNGVINYDSSSHDSGVYYLKTYDNSNQLKEFSFYSTWLKTVKVWDSAYFYNASGNIDSIHGNYYNATKGDESAYLKNIYNAQGLLEKKVYRKWNLPSTGVYEEAVNEYKYDNSNRIIEQKLSLWDANTSTHVNKALSEFTYDASGRLIELEEKVWNDGTSQWDERWLNVYTYLGGANTVNESTRSSYSTISNQYEAVSKARYVYNVNGDITVASSLSRDTNGVSFVESTRREISYNQYNQPDTIKELYHSNGPGPQPELIRKSTHVYEIYWPVNISALGSRQDAKVNVYPIPSADVITIATELKEVKDLNLSIVDMQGRVLKRWQTPRVKQLSTTIPVSDMPAGTYMLKLEGDGVDIKKRFLIVR